MNTLEDSFKNCLYFSTNSLSKVLGKIADEEFAILGLSSSFAFLLLTVLEKPGISVGEISKQLVLDQSTITRLVDKLEERKFVKRKYSGRRALISATSKSNELKPQLYQAWNSLNERYAVILGKTQSEKLASALSMAREIIS